MPTAREGWELGWRGVQRRGARRRSPASLHLPTHSPASTDADKDTAWGALRGRTWARPRHLASPPCALAPCSRRSQALSWISCFWSRQALVGGGLTKSQATPTCSSRSSRHRRWVRLWRHGHRAPLPHCGGCLSAGARRTSYGLVQSFCKHGSLSWRGDSWRGGWAVAPRAAGPCGAASSFSVRLRMHQLVCVPY